MMKYLGRPGINPWMFYTGKLSGYITWGVLVYSLCADTPEKPGKYSINEVTAYLLLAAGLVFTFVSLLNLGRSTRLGLPDDSTVLKTGGIYRISRNPMYVGFGLFTLASVIYTLNIVVAALGVFSLTVYHFIIRSEEKFLKDRFGDEYEKYRKSVRRYL